MCKNTMSSFNEGQTGIWQHGSSWQKLPTISCNVPKLERYGVMCQVLNYGGQTATFTPKQINGESIVLLYMILTSIL